MGVVGQGFLVGGAEGKGGARVGGPSPVGGGPRAMDLWQMDVMGQVFLVGGAEIKVATGIDDHSRLAGAPRRCRGPRRSCRRAGMNPDSWPTIDGLFVGHDTADGGKGLPSAAVSPSGGQPSNLMSTRPDCCICGLS